ncbi:MAG TPA: hypothetical protein VL443_11205 [Cyclobacteriaceae bacterium]|nr:hypothetical protein [Cyclobacteriaceae bacterium]
MKKLIFISLFLAALQVNAQNDTLYFSTELDINILSADFLNSKNKLAEFLRTDGIVIQKQNESKTSVSITANVNKTVYTQFNEQMPLLGFVLSRKVNTVNNNLKVNDIKLEIAFLKSKKKSYTELLSKIDDKSDKYISLWNENKLIEERIFNKERELLPYLQKENNYFINIEIVDEVMSPGSTKVAFVNMPGIEYTHLTIENPKAGVSAKTYQGYSLKYLFTKGKSFAVIGAYKSSSPVASSDTTTFSELFNLGFGQDFYSRHLGRGVKKFFNLYSGYTVGYLLATGKESRKNIFYISPSVGIELFKNKYILVDTKASYFVPFSYNNELRGLSFSASFNFVF